MLGSIYIVWAAVLSPAYSSLNPFGWISPLNGNISEECRNASRLYQSTLSSLTLNDTQSIWAAQMLDSNGRLPQEGFLSDSVPIPVDICDVLGSFWSSCKTSLPEDSRQVMLSIPVGYSHSPGSYEGCLAVNSGPVRGKYCTVDLSPPKVISDMSGGGLFEEQEEGLNDDEKHQVRIFSNMKDLSKILEKTNNIKKFAKSQPNDNSQDLAIVIEEIYDKHGKDDPSFTTPTAAQIGGIVLALYSGLNRPSIGMCFPAQCNAEDIKTNYEEMLAQFNTPDFTNKFSTEDYKCYTDKERNDSAHAMPAINIFILTFFGIIGILVVLGSLMDIVQSRNQKETVIREKPVDDSFLVKILKSFSLISNGTSLLSTSTGGSGHLDCLNGMRFISMTWVVVGHVFLISFNPFTATRNVLSTADIITGSLGLSFEALLGAVSSVDSFFFMGGTLTAYIMFKELEKAGDDVQRHTVTFIMYYVHRYLRLTVTYALIMGVVIAVLPYVYYGPAWYIISAEADNCKAYWWRHFLYINTLTVDNEQDQCMGVTWYLVDDMIFHWFAPIVFYPMFFLWKKVGHAASLSWWTLVTGAFTAGVCYINWTTKQPPSQLHIGVQQFLGTDYTYHVDLYNAPWARFQPYLVGVLLGYTLHHLRQKELKIDFILNIVLWQAAFLAAFAVVYGTYDARVTGEMSLFSATMYNTFKRLAWSFSLAWVVFSSAKGFGGIVNDFLSWSAFAPLSKLTYCCYLIHMNIILMTRSSTLASFPNDFALWSSVMYFIGNLSVSLCVAAIFTLCFEMPFTRVEKLLVGRILGAIMGGRKHVTRSTMPDPIQVNGAQKKDDIIKKEGDEKDGNNLTTIQKLPSDDINLEENTSEKPPAYTDVSEK